MLCGAAAAWGAPAASVRVTVTNPLDLARPSAAVELSAEALARHLPAARLEKLSVEDEAGRPVLAQTLDLDGDGAREALLFQADFGPRQARAFVLRAVEPPRPKPADFRVYGRFVRERFDDFAWENDRTAHRMYGPALETWQKEPLTSSTVDIWLKRTRRLVLNDWYLADDYHRDHGEGADFYSAGPSRGCGGSGLWQDGRPWNAKNFRQSRVLAAGPLRLVFELTYLPWQAGAAQVSEVKRVTLDAGSNLNRFESFYTVEGPAPQAVAVGIKKDPREERRAERAGVLRTWAPVKGGTGSFGCAVLFDPAALVDFAEADNNHLALLRLPADGRLSYHAGGGWDQSGDFASLADWDRYLNDFAAGLRAPLRVELAAAP